MQKLRTLRSDRTNSILTFFLLVGTHNLVPGISSRIRETLVFLKNLKKPSQYRTRDKIQNKGKENAAIF
jgi:hypothetical protein